MDSACSKGPFEPACPKTTEVPGVVEACRGHEGPLKLALENSVRNCRSKNAVFCASVIDSFFAACPREGRNNGVVTVSRKSRIATKSGKYNLRTIYAHELTKHVIQRLMKQVAFVPRPA